MWPNPQEIADLLAFTEDILNAKLNFFCSANAVDFLNENLTNLA